MLIKKENIKINRREREKRKKKKERKREKREGARGGAIFCALGVKH